MEGGGRRADAVLWTELLFNLTHGPSSRTAWRLNVCVLALDVWLYSGFVYVTLCYNKTVGRKVSPVCVGLAL